METMPRERARRTGSTGTGCALPRSPAPGSLRSRVRVRLAVALWLVCAGATPAAAHPWDSGVVKPTTYAGSVRKIRDEINGIETSRRAGDLADVAQRARRLAFFADPLPPV